MLKMSHQRISITQCVPSAPKFSPTGGPLRVSLLGSVRASEPRALLLPGGEQSRTWQESRDGVKEGIMGWVSSPIGSHVHYSKDLRVCHQTLPVLGTYLQSESRFYFSNLESDNILWEVRQKTGHEPLKKSPSPRPQGSFQNCDWKPRAGPKPWRKKVCRAWTNHLPRGLSSQWPSLTFSVPITRFITLILVSIFTCAWQRISASKKLQTYQAHVCGGYFPVTRQANFYLGLKPPVR